MPHFIEALAPNRIDDMIALLEECNPEKMIPLIKRLAQEEHRDGDKLAFNYFLDAIAYPIQSYKITKESKLELVQQIRRLYPNLGHAQLQQLLPILVRMDPKLETPIGLDAIQAYQDRPLPLHYSMVLLGGDIDGYNVTGALPRVQAPLKQRWLDLAEQCRITPELPEIRLAETYQAILNLLYIESIRVQNSWELVQFNKAFMHTANQFYSDSGNVVRITGAIETTSCPDWNDESEVDFAFALQRKELLQRVSTLLDNKNEKQRQELSQLYKGLLEYSTESPNPRVLHALKFLRKEHAIHKVIELEKQHLNFDNEYWQNSAFKEFTRRVLEDMFAPCNSVLLSMKKKYLFQEALEAQQNYRVLQGADVQYISDIQSICKIYQQMMPNQAELYSFVHKKLKTLVESKKSKKAWMQYFKLFVDIPVGQEVLPEQLPNINLQEFDASKTLLEELESRPTQDWSFAISPVAKKTPPKQTIKSQKTPDTMAEMSPHQEEAEAAADIAPAIVAPKQKEIVSPIILVPAMPKPFTYAYRVLRWFSANTPLDDSTFPEYTTTTLAYQKLVIAYHAFTCAVDPFVISMALEMMWHNPTTGQTDTRYILPAEISIPELDKKARGVITYCIGKRDGKVYHRFFSEKSTEDVVQKVSNQAFSEADFPSLESSANDAKMDKSDRYLPSPNTDEKIIKHPFWGTVSIENQRTKSTITLFPVKPDYLPR